MTHHQYMQAHQPTHVAMHPPLSADPGRSAGGRRSCTNQQAAAAWAWFQHGGAACGSSRSSEGRRFTGPIAAPPWKTSSFRPYSRFKKEFMASKLDQPDHTATDHPPFHSHLLPARRRRHSFHGANAPLIADGQQLQRGDNDVHLQGELGAADQLYDGENWEDHDADIHAADHDNHVQAAVGSSLLDKFELESLWRQVRPYVRPAEAEIYISAAARNNRAPTNIPTLTPAHTRPAERKLQRDSDQDTASSRGKPAASTQHHGPGRGTSSKLDDHHHNGRLRKPEFLHHLSRLRIHKPARSPVLCSSITTANSITDPHKARPPQVKLQTSLSSPLHMSQVSCMAERGQVLHRRVGKGRDQDESKQQKRAGGHADDQHYHHNHRHIHHHHHHHHHHLLHHEGDTALLKYNIPSKDGNDGGSTYNLNPKLQALQREILENSHHLDFKEPALLCKSPSKSHRHVAH